MDSYCVIIRGTRQKTRNSWITIIRRYRTVILFGYFEYCCVNTVWVFARECGGWRGSHVKLGSIEFFYFRKRGRWKLFVTLQLIYGFEHFVKFSEHFLSVQSRDGQSNIALQFNIGLIMWNKLIIYWILILKKTILSYLLKGVYLNVFVYYE